MGSNMAIDWRKRLEDKIRDGVMWKDYIVYRLLNVFKFKPFPKQVKKILVVELLKMGDLLVATPTIRALKEQFNGAQVDVLVLPEMQSILKENKYVNQVLPYTTNAKQMIQQQKYDLGIMLHPGSFKVSWLLFTAGVKYRVGCTKSGIRYGKGFFLNRKIMPNNKWQHKIEDNLDVVRSIKINTTKKDIIFPINAAAKKRVKQLLKSAKKTVIGIHAPSQHRTQQWVPERFAEVADILIKKYKCSIVFTGTKNEAPYIKHITNNIKQKKNIINLAGKTNLQEYSAVIDAVDLLISVDTGAIHVASAVKTPTVALFGPTVPPFWGPSYKKSKVIWKEKEACVGCRKYTCVFNKDFECMKSITVIDVVQQVDQLLKK